MRYRLPSTDYKAPSDFTVVPNGTVIPEGLSGMNLGGPDGGKVVVMNEEALKEQIANPMGFLEKVNPTGNIVDVPFDEIPEE